MTFQAVILRKDDACSRFSWQNFGSSSSAN